MYITWIAEGEDYIGLDTNIPLTLGDQRKCVAIIILEDNMAEEDETFALIIEELGVATSIVILDDDGKWNLSFFTLHCSHSEQ